VALFAQTSIFIAALVRKSGRDARMHTKILACIAGNWIVFSLLAAFGFLALLKGTGELTNLNWAPEVYHLMPLTGILATAYFWKYWKEVWQNQESEIKEN
jgi:hypothetical protein